MNVPVTIFTWLIAVLPIGALLVMMVKFQVPALKAAPVGLLISVITSITVYKAGPVLLAYEAVKGMWSAMVVLVVVWTAILLYEMVNEANAFQVFRKGMQKMTPNELLQILILARVFVSFLQGITGFGVPVAVGTPLLIGIGVNPLWAIVLCLLGHAWGNTYGTLAVAWDALVLQTGIGSDQTTLIQTALWATVLIWVWNFITGIAICWYYGKWEALKKGFLAVAVISVIQGGGQVVMSFINSTLACFLPCCLSLVAVLLLSKMKMYSQPWKIQDSQVMDRSREGGSQEDDSPADMSLHQAFSPYYVMTGITLFVLLVGPVKKVLSIWQVGLSFPETETGYGFVNQAVESFSPQAPFTHAGLFLFLAAVFGYFYFSRHGWIKNGGGKAALKRANKKTVPSAIAVTGFIVMSRIMGGTGQTSVMAQGIANMLGQGYAVLSPIVGMLGSFMTSSNMASNILFSGFQQTTAQLLDLNVAAILGAQTAGGAIGATMCPGNIVLGTTTGGIQGQEGAVLKKVLPISLAMAVGVGVFLFLWLVII
ncbi:MAG: L-lactate permease [Lachnoclostridium edouardi]|uniref:L-lactate permease n=1 Tax=Lachnoclostridium edouardi TaxID=1926283 RepID=UPI0026DB1AF3|nr:L-lactate permease [Lachnoclostridium edouardi]MDO4279055.1 L-lactate permease [Lachnoclostridium edouardi]